MPSKSNLYNVTSNWFAQHTLFCGIIRPRRWWHGFGSQLNQMPVHSLRSATPSNFCRPATPTGSLLFAAPRPERPSDPANPGGCLAVRVGEGSGLCQAGEPPSEACRRYATREAVEMLVWVKFGADSDVEGSRPWRASQSLSEACQEIRILSRNPTSCRNAWFTAASHAEGPGLRRASVLEGARFPNGARKRVWAVEGRPDQGRRSLLAAVSREEACRR